VGLLNPRPSPCQSWRLPPEGDHLWAGLGSFVETGCSNFLSAPAHSVAAAGSHQEFWAEQIEQLEKFCSAQIRRRSEGAFPLDPAAEQGGQNGEGGFTGAGLGILSRSAPMPWQGERLRGCAMCLFQVWPRIWRAPPPSNPSAEQRLDAWHHAGGHAGQGAVSQMLCPALSCRTMSWWAASTASGVIVLPTLRPRVEGHALTAGFSQHTVDALP
jgi:hypothetical protein